MPWLILSLMLVIFVLLGCFMESLSMILVVVELGLIAPASLNVFIISSLAEDADMRTTFKGVMPLFAAEIVRVALLLAVPGFTLSLPRWLSG